MAEESSGKTNLFWKYGTAFFDLLVVTVLVLLGFALILPFAFAFCGSVAYLAKDIRSRRLSGIFRFARENFSILLRLEILLLFMWVFPILAFFVIPATAPGYGFVIFVAYTVLILSFVILLNAPAVIEKMRVNLRQLVSNAYLLVLGSPVYSFLILTLAGVVTYLSIAVDPLFALALGLIAWADSYMNYMSFGKVAKKKG